MSNDVMNNEEYVAKAGNVCPACGSDDIEGGSIDVEGKIAKQEVSCNNCDAEWSDNYMLCGYSDLVA